MEILKTLIWILNIIAALSIIVLVLMQHGKGADAGAAFGGGSSGSIFGATGSANFLSRATAVSALIFFSSCLALVYLSHTKHDGLGVMSGEAVKAAPQIPAGATKDKQTGSKIPE